MREVVVIGCGSMGLCSAVAIQERLKDQARVTIVSEKFSPYTTSDIAAGLWEPYLLGENKTEDLLRWGQRTYDYVINLWREGKAKEAGISIQPVINLRETDTEIPVWLPITLGHSQLSSRHLKTLNEQLGTTFASGFAFVSFTWEGGKFLPYLQKQFLDNGGRIVQKKVNGFEELADFDVIVNCTGLNSRTLARDSDVTPIRGQIRRVKAPWHYTCYLIDYAQEDSCYIINNIDSIVLGGTKQESFDTNLSDADRQRFLSHVHDLVPPMRDMEVVGDMVGLRPYRSKVRLEKEILSARNGKLLKLVHNYGHGGSGITLCVGCGQHVAELVEEVLSSGNSKL